MQSDLLVNLLSRREEVLTSKRALEQELDELNTLITRYQSGLSKEELRTTSQLKELLKTPRVRGVLAAAKKAIQELPPGPFNKNQLLAKLREDEYFAAKEITAANIRSALRMLAAQKLIVVKSNATATTCATYVKATLMEEHHREPVPFGKDRKKVRAGRT